MRVGGSLVEGKELLGGPGIMAGSSSVFDSGLGLRRIRVLSFCVRRPLGQTFCFKWK